MKNFRFFLLLLIVGMGCEKAPVAEKTEHGLEPLAYTLYTEKTELFVEFKPLVVGQKTKFAAHFTALGDTFKAIGRGSVNLILQGPQATQNDKANGPASPGIFRLDLTPKQQGKYTLVFQIETPAYKDTIQIEDIQVYATAEEAQQKNPHVHGGEEQITYLKEQAWKIEFANMAVRKKPFAAVVKTSGIVLSAPGDEQTIPAKTAGTVTFVGEPLWVGAAVRPGQALFSISSKGYVDNNANVRLQEAKSQYEKTKAVFEKNQGLLADRLITQNDYLQSKAEYESAQAVYNGLSGNYSGGGQTVTASKGGYIQSLLVSEGQFVESGQPLAVVTQNRRLVIRADLSPTAYSKLQGISSANFRLNNDQAISLKDLNGNVASVGKTVDQSAFIPVYFEVDNREGLVPGTFIEVFIQTQATEQGLVIPKSAILEDQGIFYCYVQTEGESFARRDLKLGGNDGLEVLVTSGLQEGDRVVTKGAYNIKLSVASGTMPAHGHEH